MGHKNVYSVDVYGNRKSASRQVNIEVFREEYLVKVRVKEK